VARVRTGVHRAGTCRTVAGRWGLGHGRPRDGGVRPPSEARAPGLGIESRPVGEGEGPRALGRQAVCSCRARHALGLRPGPPGLLERTGRPVRGVRFLCPVAPRGDIGPAPDPSRLVRRPLPRGELPDRPRHCRLDAQSGGRARHGRGGFRRALRGDRLAPGRHGVDGRTLDVRVAGGGGPTRRGDRSSSRRLGPGRGLLHPRLSVHLATALARRPPSASGGHRFGRRRADSGARGWQARSRCPGRDGQGAVAAARALRGDALPGDRRRGGRGRPGQARGSRRVGGGERHTGRRRSRRAVGCPGFVEDGGRHPAPECVAHL